MYPEDQFLPLSGLQHMAFCPRQCALIHLERAWSDNHLTAAGRVMHERVHNGPSETRGDVRTVRELAIRSLRLGLSGMADAVEFRRADGESGAAALPNRRGFWIPYPVEYKRGRPKKGDCDAVQLCVQALCLEEMLGCRVPEAALYYGETRRRTAVPIDGRIRSRTERLADEYHALFSSGIIPAAEPKACCRSCSLKDICMPGTGRSAAAYIDRHLRDMS